MRRSWLRARRARNVVAPASDLPSATWKQRFDDAARAALSGPGFGPKRTAKMLLEIGTQPGIDLALDFHLARFPQQSEHELYVHATKGSPAFRSRAQAKATQAYAAAGKDDATRSAPAALLFALELETASCERLEQLWRETHGLAGSFANSLPSRCLKR